MMGPKAGDWVAYRPSGLFAKPFALARVVKVTAKQIAVESSTSHDRRIYRDSVTAIIGSDPQALFEKLTEIYRRTDEQVRDAKSRMRNDSAEAIADAASAVL